ncbi:hypothetical protein, partial [Enterobacter hormaechei]|uniref:hypothetical protein n=1 Tax=Enterobacter hormaechei TaxID=158836 RepID=UPI00203FDC71
RCSAAPTVMKMLQSTGLKTSEPNLNAMPVSVEAWRSGSVHWSSAPCFAAFSSPSARRYAEDAGRCSAAPTVMKMLQSTGLKTSEPNLNAMPVSVEAWRSGSVHWS